MIHRILVAVAAALLVVAPALAMDEEQAQRMTETRQGLLKVVGWSFTPLSVMARGDVAWNDEIVARNSQRVAWLVTMIPDAFRADTRAHELETRARPVVWEEFDRFEELAGNARSSAERLVEVAADGDRRATERAVRALQDDCRACHDKFRADP